MQACLQEWGGGKSDRISENERWREMNIDELEQAARGKGMMLLVIPREPTRSGSIRLTEQSGPYAAEIVCVNPRGETVARFDRAAVRRWLARQRKG